MHLWAQAVSYDICILDPDKEKNSAHSFSCSSPAFVAMMYMQRPIPMRSSKTCQIHLPATKLYTCCPTLPPGKRKHLDFKIRWNVIMLLQKLDISPLRSTEHYLEALNKHYFCVYLEILQLDKCMMQQLLSINLQNPHVNLKKIYRT